MIPTKNGIKTIAACIDSVLNQEIDMVIEIIVIDSGSTDGTVEVLKGYQPVRLVQIEPEEFGHGKTRNLGASLATGRWIVFLNGDALPADSHWLSPLIQAFRREPAAAGVFSRHLPADDCHLYMVRDLQKSMPESGWIRSRVDRLDFNLFSTVSGAVSREVWEKIPLKDDIDIAEDQAWAREVLDAGHKIVYEPESVVVHSHNYTPREFFEIKRRVSRCYSPFSNRWSAGFWGFFLIIGGMVVKICGDIVFIATRRLSLSKKLAEIGRSTAARAAGFWGRYLGWLQS